MRSRFAGLLLCCLLIPALARAAEPREEAVLLWPGGAPGSEGKANTPEVVVESEGVRRVAGIHRPSLTVYLPPKKSATGAAVIILPGGGHRYLAIDNEGHKVAAWLNAHGVAGFVLKYRLAREPGSTYTVAEHALADTQRALRLVRSRASQWGIDPARVGVIGFSAGGQLAAYAGARFDEGKPDAADPVERQSARPAFQGLIYPGAAPADLPVPRHAPPAFLCTAADDKGPTGNVLALFQKLRDGGADAELHIYARGGHGFGMKERPYPITAWAMRFHEWLGDRGFLTPAPAPPPPTRAQVELERQLVQVVRPLLDKYCVGCHGEKPKGDLDLRPFTTLRAVVADFPRWAEALDKVRAGDMPTKKAKLQPTAAERQRLVDWIEAVRREEARRTAGDPGPVLARRLSNAEYNYTIRDLTGVDIRPAREFPVDPSNPAGFDNSGESLAMSPALMKKYLGAAREVASHLVLETNGLTFASHPMLVETDRDRYCVGQIVDFYRRQNTDLAAYFQAAWRFKHRAALGKGGLTLAAVAEVQHLSPKYLTTVWRTLEGPREVVGPIAKLQALWRKLPGPRNDDAVTKGCQGMRAFVEDLRKKLEPAVPPLAVKGIPATDQPFAMWRNRQYAGARLRCDRTALQIDGQPGAPRVPTEEAKGAPVEGPAKPPAVDPDLRVPSADRARYEAAFDRFCATFPDAFFVAERGRTYGDTSKDRGRLLSAGFHNLMGYFRDDQPLYQLMLDDRQQAELDRLWHELDFVAAATRRTYEQFFLDSEGAAVSLRSDPKRPADITTTPAIFQLRDLYLSKLPADAPAAASQAIREHFEWVNSTLRWTETAHGEAEPKHLDALLAFAEKAYRRPLSFAERDGLLGYYRELRAKSHLDHEEALRDALVSVLVSPDFCYRIDQSPAAVADGAIAATTESRALPLSDHALASRLSYFLWSSMPDERLLARARAGELHRPEVLAAEARRMLKDPRARGLAVEFGGQWLDFRRFEEHNAVDRQRFPAFDDRLRVAMFEEPIHFLLDVVGEGRSVLDLLQGQHTFVNATLARHYGMPVPEGATGEGWWRVGDATKYGRGGLLPMAVFLTKNAPGLRTSPVKRGYWVVKNVLGERIPPPPAVVPELPRDEAKLDLPLREVLARHREDPSCASCHARFDALGLVFEGYGPVGEQRTKDLAGHPVDARATFPGGGEGSGIEGLRKYLRARRQDDFLDNLARKLLAYALGRSLMLSDDLTVADLKTRLARSGYRFDSLVEGVVTSPQFLTRRGPARIAAPWMR